MLETRAIEPAWPNGQRRPLQRDATRFSAGQVRAARALMGLTATEAAEIACLDLGVCLTAAQVDAFERGGELDDLRYAALCHVLYRDRSGVVAVAEGGAGEGVRFARPAEPGWAPVKGASGESRWPSGQRRHPLRDRIAFSPRQARAGRALMGLTTEQVAGRAGHWPLGVYLTAAQVEAFEGGGELDELRHAAVCHVLYREGYGVVAVGGGRAGEGVRFALPAERRAEGTHADRRWRPVWDAMDRRAREIQEYEARMLAKHGPNWVYDLSIPPAPIGAIQRTDGQSGPEPAEGPCAP